MITSPRFLRPDTIQIKNALGEDSLCIMQYSAATIERVKVDGSYGYNLSKRGVITQDKLLVTIDMNDYKSNKTYADNDHFSDPVTQFTFRNDSDDLIVYKNKEYRITNINPIQPVRNAPYLLEIVCQ